MKLKTEILLIRLSENDKKFVRTMAQKEGLTMSSFMLMLIKNYKYKNERGC